MSHLSSSSVECLMHHKNGFFDDSNPKPSSMFCSVATRAKLPKQTNITDSGSLESNHFKQSCSLMPPLLPLSAISRKLLLHSETGPIHQTFLPFTFASSST
ncbi:hypothetical protein HanRHA438_Chr01g0041691 [Helianthus annuus]|nr:hypothetical protein HanRHA438_Chr01g0041691 [Helianthus annuus]